MKVIAIAAVSKNGVIGKGSGLPWDIPEDMRFFRESTKGQIVIMGRKTFESLGKPLPQRENAVITRNDDWSPSLSGAQRLSLFKDLKMSIDHYKSLEKEFSGKDIFVIGGAQIYGISFDLIDELWLTEIEETAEGDVCFPQYSNGKFLDDRFVMVSSVRQSDLNSPYHYSFNRYRRKNDIK